MVYFVHNLKELGICKLFIRMSIMLKVLVDKEKQRVLFAEADADFVDVLFSFLTMPMGSIVRLTSDELPTAIGCMNNLYASVKNLDFNYLNCASKRMLMYPRTGAAAQYQNLKLQIDGKSRNDWFFYCGDEECLRYKHKLVSYLPYGHCACGEFISTWLPVSYPQEPEAFVKEKTRLIITDELQVTPASSAGTFSLLSKLGVADASTVECRIYYIGSDEVLTLLRSSLISKAPLTECFLMNCETPEISGENLYRWTKSSCSSLENQENKKINVKLFVSKSKKIVCYAEAGEDFVNLLFSFLTIPLGHIVKQMHGAPSKGCIHHLYKSIQELDVQKYFNSNVEKEILLSPKIAPKFGYDNQLIGVEEVSLHYCESDDAAPYISADIPCDGTAIALTVKDSKLQIDKKTTSNGGFVEGPAMFTVTDNLFATPISPIIGVSILNILNVPFSDIEERVVHVGSDEASRLLVASFTSESVLTDTFIPKTPRREDLSGDCPSRPDTSIWEISEDGGYAFQPC